MNGLHCLASERAMEAIRSGKKHRAWVIHANELMSTIAFEDAVTADETRGAKG